MRIKTQTCHRHRHPEFVLQCDDAIAFDAPYLVTWLEDEVASGVVFRPGESVQVGWSALLVEQTDDGLLTLKELDLSGVAAQFDRSVTRTLFALRTQKAVLESFGIEDRLDFPSLQMSAIRCNRYPSPQESVLSRLAPIHANDSGWFFGCNGDSHDHNLPDNLIRASLYDIACRVPGNIAFLAMPVGSTLQLDKNGSLVAGYLADGEKLVIRKGSYLDRKPGKSDL